MKYTYGTIVYVVADFKVVQATIKKIFTESSAEENLEYYHVKPYNSDKLIRVDEKSLYTDIEKAKEMALQNLKALSAKLEEDIKSLTEKTYIILKEENKDGKRVEVRNS